MSISKEFINSIEEVTTPRKTDCVKLVTPETTLFYRTTEDIRQLDITLPKILGIVMIKATISSEKVTKRVKFDDGKSRLNSATTEEVILDDNDIKKATSLARHPHLAKAIMAFKYFSRLSAEEKSVYEVWNQENERRNSFPELDILILAREAGLDLFGDENRQPYSWGNLDTTRYR